MTTKLRWSFLSMALIATITAIFYPVEEQQKPPEPKLIESSNRDATLSNRNQLTEAEHDLEADPFAVRNWANNTPAEAPTSVPPSSPSSTQVITVVAPPTTGPLQLPYRFLGKLVDGNDFIVYLAHGEQMLPARTGDVLDGNYKVLSINERSIEFEHIASSEKLTLNIE